MGSWDIVIYWQQEEDEEEKMQLPGFFGIDTEMRYEQNKSYIYWYCDLWNYDLNPIGTHAGPIRIGGNGIYPRFNYMFVG